MLNLLLKILILLTLSSCSLFGDLIDRDAEKPALNLGTSPYAIRSPYFNCPVYMGSLDSITDVNFSFLWESFGESPDCLRRMLSDSRVRTVEVHGINGTCVKGRWPDGRCQHYELLHNVSKEQHEQFVLSREGWFMERYRNLFKGIAEWVGSVPDNVSRIYISPILESDLSPTASRIVLDTIKPLFTDPRVKFVWNANYWPENNLNGHDFVETHWDFRIPTVPYLVNLDGVSTDYPDVNRCGPNWYPRRWTVEETRRWITTHLPHAEMIYLWDAHNNCFECSWQPPRSRTCSRFTAQACQGNLIRERQ